MKSSPNNQIVEQLAKDKLVEHLVSKYAPLSKPYIKDLAQDIYIELLNKPEWLLMHLIENEEIEYYIRRIIKNQLFSKTSRYYYNYKKFLEKTDEITEKERQLQNHTKMDI